MTNIEVFYIGGKTGWATARFDDGNQMGEASFHWRKSDAVSDGRQWANSLNCELHIYSATGTCRIIPTHQV